MELQNGKKSLFGFYDVADEYAKNEYRTNFIVTFLLLGFVLIGIVDLILFNIDSSRTLLDTNRIVFIPINTTLLIMAAISFAKRFRASWIKNMLLSGTVLVCSVAFFVFTSYTIYMLYIPIFIASRYFNRKITIHISIITVLLFFVACFLNFVLEHTSPVIHMLHENAMYNPWTSFGDFMIYLVLPCALLMVFLAFFAVNITDSGRTLIAAKIEDRTKIASVDAELSMAAQIQKSVLPKTSFKTGDGNFSVFADEIPAKEVCGDFYDYFMLNDNVLGVVVADVSDKGVPAAMFMMSAKKVLRCALASCDNLSDAVILANKLICSDNEYGMFLTLWMGLIDTKSGVGKYVNAGHPFPVLRRTDGTAKLLQNEPDLFLGNFPEKNPAVHTFRIAPGESLVIFTDGLTDSTDKSGSSYGTEQMLAHITDYEAPEGLTADLMQSVKDFSAGTTQFDDITVLTLKCNALAVPLLLECTVKTGTDGTAAINDKMQEALREAGCPDKKRRDIGVVIDELCTNIAEYAYKEQGEIAFCGELGHNYLQMHFTDSGMPFNPVEQDSAPPEPLQIGGLGIYLVKSLSDKVSYTYSQDKNHLDVLFIWDI